MSEEVVKQLLGIGAATLSAVVSALCAAFIPLLHRSRRAEQEVAIGLKEAERIEKVLAVAAKLKADHGVETDVAEVAARLRIVMAQMASDQVKSDDLIRKYYKDAVGLWGTILNPLPKIREPKSLSFQLRFPRLLPAIMAFFFLLQNLLSWFFAASKPDMPQQYDASEVFLVLL